MKKVVSLFAVVALGVSAYVFFSKDNKVEVENETLVSKEAKKEVEKKKAAQSARVIKAKSLNTDKNIEAKMEGWDAKFDQIESAWNDKTKKLFLEEFGLEEKMYKEYKKMKVGLDNDKVRAFESFHKEMEAKYGASYSYNPTEQERQFEKDIKTKYDEVLKKRIGEKNFVRYLEVRDRFNQDLMEKQDPEEGVILMDF